MRISRSAARGSPISSGHHDRVHADLRSRALGIAIIGVVLTLKSASTEQSPFSRQADLLLGDNPALLFELRLVRGFWSEVQIRFS
jgi:hypothetical protein